MHPDDLQDAIGRATKAANRAGALPRRWAALAVECGGRWYVVVFAVITYAGRTGTPVRAVYRIRPDLRLRRIVRWPLNLPNTARAKLGATPLLEVEHPGQREGWLMTSARLAQRVRCEVS
jgi:hypothetical protein